MNRKAMLCLVVATLLLGTSGPAAVAAEEPPAPPPAQPPPTAPPSEPAAPRPSGLTEEVTVVAAPVVESTTVDDFGNPIVTVGEKQIEGLAAVDFASALRRVPGVVISRYNPVGSYGGGEGGAIYIRGQGSGRPGAEITTLYDGLPRFVGVWTHPLLDTMPVQSAARIEVHKAPEPALIGNMAFAAVNLVPKRWTGDGHGGRLLAEVGSDRFAQGALEYGGRSGSFDYYAAASGSRSDGARENADGQVTDLYARGGWEFAPGWTLSLLADFSSGWANDPGPVGAPQPSVTPKFEIDDRFGVLALERAGERWSGSLRLYADDGAIDWLQSEAGPAGEDVFSTLTDYLNYGARLRATLKLAQKGELVAGFDQDVYGGTARETRQGQPDAELGDFSFRNSSPYLALSWAFPLGGGANELVPSAGVRYNDSRYFGGDWGGQAGLVLRGSWGQVYARWSDSYNLPGVWTAFLYGGFGPRRDEWQDLAPERVRQYEVGTGLALGRDAQLDVSLFRSAASDALRFIPPPPPPPYFDNVGSYTVRGVEATLTWRAARALELMAGATWTSTDPENVPYTPEWTAVAGLSWSPATRWSVNLDGQWVDDRYAGNPRFPGAPALVDGYVLINGRVGFQLSTRGDGLELFVAGDNLTDAEYSYRPDYPMPGATVRGGVL
nr:TonB-dependent receptor plug domain-containing protein [Acidobacteriota bacterium]